MKKIIPFFTLIYKNKYYLVVAVFLVWIFFVDRNNVFTQIGYRTKLNKLSNDKKYYKEEIKKVNQEYYDLNTNAKTIEKYAREHYLMKKDSEDIFIIEKKERP